ncbi:MAG: peptidoglycan-binding protein [Cyanobacteria bacterium P01_C01_bin.73]
MPVLRPGDSGTDVRYLKQRLKEAQCLPESASLVVVVPNLEYYDDVTSAAVRSFQRQHGLLVDGIAGSRTHAALERGLFCQASKDSGVLEFGDQGEEVELLQIQLKNRGFPLAGQEQLQVTGEFDQLTVEALTEFENFFGLKEDGILDPLDSELLWAEEGEALALRFIKLNAAGPNEDLNRPRAAIAAMGADAVPYIEEFLESPSSPIRGDAATFLGELGAANEAAAETAAKALIPLLGDTSDVDAPNRIVKDSALDALMMIGPTTASVTNTLEETLQTSYGTRLYAAVALLEVDPSLAVLINNLKSNDPEVSQVSARVLGLADPSNQAVIDALQETLNNPQLEDPQDNLQLRKYTAIALTLLGQEIEPSNFDSAFQAVYAEFYAKWEDCPRTWREVGIGETETDESRPMGYFSPIEGVCASTATGGGGDIFGFIFKRLASNQ